MSWDVLLVNGAVELPIGDEDHISPQLGSKVEILSALRRGFTGVSFPDGQWDFFDADDYSIEINLGLRDPVTYVALHVRGSDKVILTIRRLCQQTGWHAYDTVTRSFIDLSQNPAEGWQRWRGARDQVSEYLEGQGETVGKDAAIVIARTRKKWWEFWR